VSAEHAPLDNKAAPVQPIPQRRTRILSIQGKRRIFALEHPLWTALERMAARKGTRLNLLIASLLSAPGDGNQTSNLRAATATWLLDECDRVQEQLLASTRGILSAIPAPAVTMTVGQQVIAQNSSFALLATQKLAVKEEPGAGADLTLRLNVPPARLMALLTADPHRAVGAPFTLTSARSKISGIMNTAIIMQSGSTPLFLCVVRSLAEQS
jgi:predicted DNA-binding ribbon-helix-helix protein